MKNEQPSTQMQTEFAPHNLTKAQVWAWAGAKKREMLEQGWSFLPTSTTGDDGDGVYFFMGNDMQMGARIDFYKTARTA